MQSTKYTNKSKDKARENGTMNRVWIWAVAGLCAMGAVAQADESKPLFAMVPGDAVAYETSSAIEMTGMADPVQVVVKTEFVVLDKRDTRLMVMGTSTVDIPGQERPRGSLNEISYTFPLGINGKVSPALAMPWTGLAGEPPFLFFEIPSEDKATSAPVPLPLGMDISLPFERRDTSDGQTHFTMATDAAVWIQPEARLTSYTLDYLISDNAPETMDLAFRLELKEPGTTNTISQEMTVQTRRTEKKKIDATHLKQLQDDATSASVVFGALERLEQMTEGPSPVELDMLFAQLMTYVRERPDGVFAERVKATAMQLQQARKQMEAQAQQPQVKQGMPPAIDE